MTNATTPDEVRRRVRALATPQLELLAGGLGQVDISGPTPTGAVERLDAMRCEIYAELARRGVIVIPDPDPEPDKPFGSLGYV